MPYFESFSYTKRIKYQRTKRTVQFKVDLEKGYCEGYRTNYQWRSRFLTKYGEEEKEKGGGGGAGARGGAGGEGKGEEGEGEVDSSNSE